MTPRVAGTRLALALHMVSHEPRGPAPDHTTPDAPRPVGARRSHAEIRAIAAQLAREVREPPGASPTGQLSAQRYELAPADEERVDDALVAVGAADPEDTMRAEREAAGEATPRPTSWALNGDTPDGTPDGPRKGRGGD